jgi:hypothetical protein
LRLKKMTEHSSQSAMKIRCPGCGHKLDVSELAPLSLHPCPRCGVEFRVPKWFQSILLEDILYEEPALQVYRALDTTLDREVCVKVVAAGSRFSEEQLEAFLSVTRRMAVVAHPQVVSVYACGRSDDGAAYVVQQYVPTISYAETKKQMTPALLQRYGLCIIDALKAADAADICHGGLGPGNILFGKDNFVRVTDFGVARALGKDAEADPYAGPDVRSGAAVSTASDLYSLGVILYELATGCRPAEARTPLHVSHPSYSQAFGECLERMLSERPEERPDSYAEIFSILERKSLARQGTGKVFRNGGARAAGGRRPGDLVSPAARPVQRSERRRGSNIVNVLLLCAFLALCAVFLAYRLQQRRAADMSGMVSPSLTASKTAAAGEALGELPGGTGGKREAEGGVAVIAPAVWASRPQPPDLDFKATREENKRYLEAVPAALQETERDRLRILGLALDYLQQTMRYIGYDRGENGRIMLRDGRSYLGAIPRANEKGLTIRRRDLAETDTEASMQVGFADLAWPQLWDIFAFYAEKRLDMAVNKRQERIAARDSFDNYLQLALLCDWYGFPEDSRRYAGMAVAAQPGKEYLLRKYGLAAAPR